ncbi:MAG: hypothetical protein JNK38_18200 [Acidobacteria bacterium]|nr:hypothetical protein [Acidobacteriota bacterium]
MPEPNTSTNNQEANSKNVQPTENQEANSKNVQSTEAQSKKWFNFIWPTVIGIGKKLIPVVLIVFGILTLHWLNQQSKDYESGLYSFDKASEKLAGVTIPFPENVLRDIETSREQGDELTAREISSLVANAVPKDSRQRKIVGLIRSYTYSDTVYRLTKKDIDELKESKLEDKTPFPKIAIVHLESLNCKKKKCVQVIGTEIRGQDNFVKMFRLSELSDEINEIGKANTDFELANEVQDKIIRKARFRVFYKINDQAIAKLKSTSLTFPEDIIKKLNEKSQNSGGEEKAIVGRDKFEDRLREILVGTTYESSSPEQKSKIRATIAERLKTDSTNNKWAEISKAFFLPGEYLHLFYHFICLILALVALIPALFLISRIFRPFSFVKDETQKGYTDILLDKLKGLTEGKGGVADSAARMLAATAITVGVGAMALTVAVSLPEGASLQSVNSLNTKNSATTSASSASQSNLENTVSLDPEKMDKLIQSITDNMDAFRKNGETLSDLLKSQEAFNNSLPGVMDKQLDVIKNELKEERTQASLDANRDRIMNALRSGLIRDDVQSQFKQQLSAVETKLDLQNRNLEKTLSILDTKFDHQNRNLQNTLSMLSLFQSDRNSIQNRLSLIDSKLTAPLKMAEFDAEIRRQLNERNLLSQLLHRGGGVKAFYISDKTRFEKLVNQNCPGLLAKIQTQGRRITPEQVTGIIFAGQKEFDKALKYTGIDQNTGDEGKVCRNKIIEESRVTSYKKVLDEMSLAGRQPSESNGNSQR